MIDICYSTYQLNFQRTIWIRISNEKRKEERKEGRKIFVHIQMKITRKAIEKLIWQN